LATLARELGVPIQWLLTGTHRPGPELRDVAVELRHLGVVDLFVPDARVPGAFRPPEQLVARILSGRSPDPRLVEAVPAVLAWNAWDGRLLEAYALTYDARAAHRIAWLAEVTLTLHRSRPFPGGVAEPLVLQRYVESTPRPEEPDDLGRPALAEPVPPVSRRWNVTYAATLSTFEERARQLNSLRLKEGPLARPGELPR
jgi:hypothetical protein